MKRTVEQIRLNKTWEEKYGVKALEERKKLEEKLNNWLNGKELTDHNKTGIKNALFRANINTIEDLGFYIENNIKIRGLSNHFGMKFVRDFYNEQQQFNKEVEEMVDKACEKSNIGWALKVDENVEKDERINIKNSYINLIKNELNKIEDLLNFSEFNDDDIDKLRDIYRLMKDSF